MDKKNQGITFTVVILTAVISVILGVYFAQHIKKTYKYHGTVLTQARVLKPFDFSATKDKRFSSETVKDHWTFVFFGFTHCPMMCPTTMNEMNQVYNQLKKDGIDKLPEIVMVTVDPERDTLQRMHEYLTGFNPTFMGAVTTDAALRAMTNEVGIAYEKVENKNNKPGEYDMQHSGAILVLNPEGQLTAFFNWPHKVADMVEDYKHLIS